MLSIRPHNVINMTTGFVDNDDRYNGDRVYDGVIEESIAGWWTMLLAR
jgi:hypothetical protein